MLANKKYDEKQAIKFIQKDLSANSSIVPTEQLIKAILDSELRYLKLIGLAK